MPPRRFFAAGLAALGLALGTLSGASWVLAERAPNVAPANEPVRAQTSPDFATSRERGLALLAAKGCLACHAQTEAVARYRPGTMTNIGPDLTNLRERFPPQPASLAYLRRWLKDPGALKPNTPMPTLGLSDAEIDALLHFLLGEAYFPPR